MDFCRKRFSTFVLVGGQRVRLTPPPNSSWDLILVSCISGKRPLSIINEIQASNKSSTTKNTFITFDSDTPSLQYTSMRISKSIPFVCYLSRKNGCIQFIFSSSDSHDKLEVEQINKESMCACFQTQNYAQFILNEIRRIIKSEQPLITLVSLLSKLDQRAYFKSHICNFETVISDAIDLFLGQMTSTIERQARQLIKFIDFQMTIAQRDLYIIEALIIKRILIKFPRLKLVLNHIIINTQNCLIFILLFLEDDQFDLSLFLHHLPYPKYVDVTTSFRILTYLVDSQIPFYGALLGLFTSYVPPHLLKWLLSSNKIYCDSNFSYIFLNQFNNNAKHLFHIDNKSKIVFQRNEIDIQRPSKNHCIIEIKPSLKTKKKDVHKLIDQRNEWSFSKVENINRKTDCVVIIDRNKELSKAVKFEFSSFNTFSYIAQTKSSDSSDSFIIVLSALFAVAILIFVWTHFTYYID